MNFYPPEGHSHFDPENRRPLDFLEDVYWVDVSRYSHDDGSHSTYGADLSYGLTDEEVQQILDGLDIADTPEEQIFKSSKKENWDADHEELWFEQLDRLRELPERQD